ncbi:hypothetical protein [Enterococcus sp. AZ192]|uniref:hypothetical protein n=1 Tax=unclassified Enterococcus TaxID=2608891 RepID=UPI003D2BEDCD
MATPSWNKKLSEVLGYQTQEITKVSPRTGNEYTTDAIPTLNISSTGIVSPLDDGYFRYSVVDIQKQLEYEIKVKNKIDVQLGTPLSFKNVVGGSLDNGRSWYSADSVEVLKRNG